MELHKDIKLYVNDSLDLELDEKFRMLDCYKTQGERVFMSKDYIFDMARTRGLQIDANYAECYEAIRIVF